MIILTMLFTTSLDCPVRTNTSHLKDSNFTHWCAVWGNLLKNNASYKGALVYLWNLSKMIAQAKGTVPTGNAYHYSLDTCSLSLGISQTCQDWTCRHPRRVVDNWRTVCGWCSMNPLPLLYNCAQPPCGWTEQQNNA